ncbi:MAG: 2OG-Fe(II) oxygenase [Sphingomonadaceae bacterium]|nr:2OG-Fe(II) oxygenase [Sphingomonadaceae bacterium]
MSVTGESDYRIRIGHEVRKRLEGAPNALKIDSYDLDMFIVRDFLDHADCDTLVAMIDANRTPSKLLSPSADPDFRTSDSCNLDPFDPFVQKIEAKIAGLLGIEPSHGETMQGQRYAPGQRFKLHHDFFETHQPYWEEMARCGGQRTWTAMIFLNHVEGGGETGFPRISVKVTPRKGNMLVWNNLNIIGEPNYFSLHEGMPVTAGTKYIITKWHRERPWTYCTAQVY